MKQRIITSCVGAPILILLIACGAWPLRILILAGSIIGMHELYTAFSNGENLGVHLIGYFFAAVYAAMIESISVSVPNMNVFISLFLVCILVYTVICYPRSKAVDALVTFFGFFYVCFLMMNIYLIRSYTYGIFYVWLPFICAWGSDTGAYFVGIKFGTHKLVPALSPKKTVEGAVGGIASAVLLAVIYGLAVNIFFPHEGVNTVLLCFFTALIGSVLGQIGDLAASSIKRYTGIKDFGYLLPGHGGILDRMDSVLLAAPAVYYIMLIMISIQ